ncbi:MAG: PINc/VapC family ATPase [Methanimicrococcus sp.]|nr:PINc/VapC family ATPase [Methanimicrococcus sp.]
MVQFKSQQKNSSGSFDSSDSSGSSDSLEFESEFSFNPAQKVSADIVVADTSAVVFGVLSESISNGRYVPERNDVLTVIIPEAVLAELENQTNQKKEIGAFGLREILKLRGMDEDGRLHLTFEGMRPTLHQIKDAKLGEVDALIRQTALDAGGLFVTSDKVQAAVGRARGLRVDYVPAKNAGAADASELSVSAFFDEKTMSVHLKANIFPMAKRGSVGEMKYIPIRNTVCTEPELRAVKSELFKFAKNDSESFIEAEKEGASLLQIRDMRIAITEPPFSDDFEITIVRPIASVNFEKYKANDILKERILEQRGVLIAGAPGAGKSTFSAAVAKFLLENGNVVKTMESPRDLQVPPEITQYAPLEGKMENTADLLLLVRPDYTIYDEVRKTQDFMLFADMRLAGVGMIGVVHATRAIDAVQRLIGRIELGVIPQVVDTVIFIDKGEISQVYTLEFTVKVPHGMMEADLARPVIVVREISSNKTEYEIYTYGEQVVVMPVGAGNVSSFTERKPFWEDSEKLLSDEVERYISGPFEAEMISDINAVLKIRAADKKKIIGRGGETINRIEADTGLRIDVREMPVHYFPRSEKYDYKKSFKEDIRPENFKRYDDAADAHGNNPDYVVPIFEKTKKHFILRVPEFSGKDVDVFISETPFFSATVGRSGDIKLRLDSELVERIKTGFRNGELIEARLSRQPE